MNVFAQSWLLRIDDNDYKFKIIFKLIHPNHNAGAIQTRNMNSIGVKERKGMSFWRNELSDQKTTHEVRTQKVLKVPITLFFRITTSWWSRNKFFMICMTIPSENTWESRQKWARIQTKTQNLFTVTWFKPSFTIDEIWLHEVLHSIKKPLFEICTNNWTSS